MNHSQKRIVTVSLPNKGFEQVATIILAQDSPYKLIESLKENWKQELKQDESFFGNFEIGEVLPIHNASGIRDQSQISQMQEYLKQGQDIFGRDQLPNIKLVVVPNQKLLLFDGHHSLLSYFNHGKRFLREIPYIVISGENNQEVSDEEISFFFPENNREEILKDWKRFTVNWQAEVGEQLEVRRVYSIAELARELGKGNESAVKQ